MEKDMLHSIMDAIRDTSIAECEIAAKNASIRILRKPGGSGIRTRPVDAVVAVPEDDKIVDETTDVFDVTSDWVGYFYRGVAQNEKPLVKLRELVKEGQQVGSVVTMNVVQKVAAPVAGKLVEVLVEDGQPVEYGQPLLRIRTDNQEVI